LEIINKETNKNLTNVGKQQIMGQRANKKVNERKKRQRQENTKHFIGSLISTLKSHADV
jgi:hypothetical protein